MSRSCSSIARYHHILGLERCLEKKCIEKPRNPFFLIELAHEVD